MQRPDGAGVQSRRPIRNLGDAMRLDERYYTADQPHELPEPRGPLSWRPSMLWPALAVIALGAVFLLAAF